MFATAVRRTKRVIQLITTDTQNYCDTLRKTSTVVCTRPVHLLAEKLLIDFNNHLLQQK